MIPNFDDPPNSWFATLFMEKEKLRNCNCYDWFYNDVRLYGKCPKTNPTIRTSFVTFCFKLKFYQTFILFYHTVFARILCFFIRKISHFKIRVSIYLNHRLQTDGNYIFRKSEPILEKYSTCTVRVCTCVHRWNIFLGLALVYWKYMFLYFLWNSRWDKNMIKIWAFSYADKWTKQTQFYFYCAQVYWAKGKVFLDVYHYRRIPLLPGMYYFKYTRRKENLNSVLSL